MADWASTSMVDNPARGQLNRENDFPYPRCLCLRIWSRQTGSAVLSHVSPLNLHTKAESGVYSRAPLLPPAFRDRYYIVCILYTILYTIYTIYDDDDDDGAHPYRQPSSGSTSLTFNWFQVVRNKFST